MNALYPHRARDRVRLTKFELEYCREVGELRYADAIARHRAGNGVSRRNDGPHLHVLGATAEFAGHILINLYWRPNVGVIGQRDLGGLVEVRSTRHRPGLLAIMPKDHDGAYMLVLPADDDSEFWCPGWCGAAYAKGRYPLRAMSADATPVHYVPQADLRPLDELRALVHGQVVSA